MDVSRLALTASVGAALLLLGALAAAGGRRTVGLVQRMGWGGVLLALFVGAAMESLSGPLAESKPYTLLFRDSTDLRAQALMEDADLRNRYNVDPRLRYLPSDGGRVPNLESAYALNGPLGRPLIFPVLEHGRPVWRPAGIEPVSSSGDPKALRAEIAGLYESAASLVDRRGHPASEDRLSLVRTASVGLLAMGILALVAGLVPLLGRGLAFGADAARLARATRHPSYGAGRRRAVGAGACGLWEWHGERARPHAALAAFGLLALLGGVVLGLLREEETRRVAHETFAQARHLRIDAGR